MMTLSEKNQLLFEKALIAHNFMKNHLPKRIEILNSDDRPELNFKLLKARACLLHRLSDIAKSAIVAFSREETLSAIVLTKALVETVAYMELLRARLVMTLEKGNWQQLREWLESGMSDAPKEPGNNNAKILFEAMAVLGAIDDLEKWCPGFKWQYEALCDFAIPNHCGANNYHGHSVNKRTYQLTSSQKRTYPLTVGLNAFHNVITAAVSISESFERDWQRYQATARRLSRKQLKTKQQSVEVTV